MRKIILFPSFACFLLFSVCRLSAQIVPNNLHGPATILAATENENTIVTTSLTGNVFCAGSTVPVSYTAAGTYDPSNVFSVQLSDATGSFTTYSEIGSLASQTAGTINAIVPVATPPGSGYRIRVVSSSPATVGSDNGSNIVITAVPSIPLANSYCTNSQSVLLGQQTFPFTQPLPMMYTGPGITITENTEVFTFITTRYYFFSPIVAGPGMHTINATGTNGCNISKQVTVNALPVLNVLSSPSPCAPGTVDLTLLIDAANSTIPAGSTTEYFLNNEVVLNPAAVSQSGNYVIRVTSPSGCSAEQTVPVSIRSQTPINLIDSYCTSAAPVFLGQDFYNVFTNPLPPFIWTGPGVFTNTVTDIFGINITRNYFFSPVQAGVGTHTINATSTSSTCSNSKVVTVGASPVLNVLPSPSPCAPGTVDLTLLVDQNNSTIPVGSIYEYLLDNTAVANPAAVGQSGNYVIRVTSPNGCTAEKTVPVTIRSQTPINLSDTYCADNQIVLLGQDFYTAFTNPVPTPIWTGPGVFTSTTTDIFGINITRNYFFSSTQAGVGTHTINATATVASCSNSKVVVVNASPVLNVLNAPSPCAPGTVDLTLLIDHANSNIPPDATIEYLLNDAAVADPTSINQSGNYVVKVTTASGCSAQRTVPVTINAQPSIPLADSYCTNSGLINIGSEVITIPLNGQPPPPIRWTGPGVGYSYILLGTNIFTFTSDYLVLYTFNPAIGGTGPRTISASIKGCTNSKQVIVNEAPVLKVLATPVPSPCAPGTVDLTARIDQANSVIPENATFEYFLNGTAVPDPTAVSQTGDYEIRLTSPNGCSSAQTVHVEIRPLASIPLSNSYCSSQGTVFMGQDMYPFNSPLPPSLWTGDGITEQLVTVFQFPNLYIQRLYYFTPATAGVGSHTITANNLYGCSNTKQVVVNASPVLNVLSSTPVCAPSTVDLTLLIDQENSTIPTDATIEYLFNDVAVANPTAVNQSGDYVIRVTSSSGCSVQQTVPVLIKPQPNIPLANTYCSNQGTVFMGQDMYLLGSLPPPALWSGDGITEQQVTILQFPNFYIQRLYYFSAATAGVGSHTITANSLNGCSNTKVVTVNATPVLALLQAPIQCGGTVDLTSLIDQQNSVIPQDATVEYLLNGAGVTDPTSVSQSGNYTIRVTSPNGCMAQQNIAVTIKPVPVIPLADVYCNNANQVFLGQDTYPFGTQPPPLYSGTGILVDETLNPFTFIVTRTYKFLPIVGVPGERTITATSPNGCTISKTITIKPGPFVNLTAIPSPCYPGTVDLTSLIDMNNSFIPSDATIEYLLNGVPVTDPTSVSVNGNYTIRVSTPNGCSEVRNVPVTIRPLPVINLPDTYCSNSAPVFLSQETFSIFGPYPPLFWSGPGISVEDVGNPFTFIVTRTYRFFPSAVGTGDVTITRMSPNGCTTSKVITINGAPVITCPGDKVVNNDNGQCGAIVSFNTPTVSGGCGNVAVVQTAGPQSGSLFPVGNTTVSFTATDASGNETSCSFTVTVTDTEKPKLDCGANIHVVNDPGKCGALISLTSPVATDNCQGNLVVNGSRSDGQPLNAMFPVGSTTVTWNTTDASGNTASCIQEVVVTDNEKPVVMNCPADMHITTGIQNSSCSQTVNWTPPDATDNCGNVSVSSSHHPGDIFNTGTTKVTYTFTDSHGNSSTCSFDVNVTDDTKPVVNCPADKFFCYSNTGIYTVDQLIATDNCSISNISYVITGATSRSGNGKDASGSFLPGTSTVMWTVTDGSGNTSTCSMQVVVNPKMTVSIPDVFAVSPGGLANTIYIGYGAPSVTLSANAGGGTPGYTYSWSTGSSSPSITVNPSVPGNYVYNVTVTDSKGCQVTTSKTIVVTDARCGNKMEKVLVCHNGQEICISSNAVDAHLQHGDALGYCSTDILVKTQAKPDEEFLEATLKVDILPNPSSNEFKMIIQSKNEDLLNVTVTDNLGRNVFATSKIPANKTLVFGKNFRPGSYFVVVQQGKEIQTFKLIKVGN